MDWTGRKVFQMWGGARDGCACIYFMCMRGEEGDWCFGFRSLGMVCCVSGMGAAFIGTGGCSGIGFGVKQSERLRPVQERGFCYWSCSWWRRAV